ncbi:hypothetical protein AB6869_21710 [Rahnella rivi]|uniref:hypothetical protein n=1 Tax=Rahnella rivi TaxID=2816249 RepID=UPI0039BDC6F4
MSRTVIKSTLLKLALLAFSSSAFPVIPVANASPSSLQTSIDPEHSLLTSNKDCMKCVNFMVTAFLFEPDPLVKVTYDLDRFQKLLTDQGMTPVKHGFPLYLHADSKKVAAAFLPYGKFTQVLHWAGTTLPDEPLPIKVTNLSSSFEGVLKWSPISPRDPRLPMAAGSRTGLVSYDLKVSEGPPEISSSGRVLFSDGSSMLDVYKLDNRYVVFLIQVSSS